MNNEYSSREKLSESDKRSVWHGALATFPHATNGGSFKAHVDDVKRAFIGLFSDEKVSRATLTPNTISVGNHLYSINCWLKQISQLLQSECSITPVSEQGRRKVIETFYRELIVQLLKSEHLETSDSNVLTMISFLSRNNLDLIEFLESCVARADAPEYLQSILNGQLKSQTEKHHHES